MGPLRDPPSEAAERAKDRSDETFGGEASDASSVAKPRRAAVRANPALSATVEQTVVPRLTLLGAGDCERFFGAPETPSEPHARSVERLVREAIGPVPDAARGVLLEHDRGGWSPERLCVDLIAPAARRMGELWLEDHCTFTDVTLGCLRLCSTLRELADRPRDAAFWPEGRRVGVVMIAPAPGDGHTLGAAMLGFLFERAGWRVIGGAPEEARALERRAREQHVDVIALSVSERERAGALGGLIGRIRRASRNRGLGVMVGGPAFLENPGLAARIGADAFAVDARHAVRRATRLLELAGARR